MQHQNNAHNSSVTTPSCVHHNMFTTLSQHYDIAPSQNHHNTIVTPLQCSRWRRHNIYNSTITTFFSILTTNALGGVCKDLVGSHMCDCGIHKNPRHNFRPIPTSRYLLSPTLVPTTYVQPTAHTALGWTGPDCTIDVDECLSFPCENGGTCAQGVGIFECTCAEGYQGDGLLLLPLSPCKLL
jgi:hypothetical protein